MFYIHTNDHESLTNWSLYFLFLFASALALFPVSLSVKNGFSIFFLSEAFFIISSLTICGYNRL